MVLRAAGGILPKQSGTFALLAAYHRSDGTGKPAVAYQAARSNARAAFCVSGRGHGGEPCVGPGSAGPSQPSTPGLTGGLSRVEEGLSGGYCSTPSFGQMKLPSLLALNTGDRAIGDSLVSVSIQGYPN
jgi:hypothetical protein